MPDELLYADATSMTAGQLARRQRIVEAVLDLLETTDLEKVGMREVAERSHVALGTTYRYFASKEHLLAAAWAEWHRRLTRQVLAEMESEDRSRAGAEDRVVAYIQRQLRSFQRTPNFAKVVVFVSTCPDTATSEAIDELDVENEKVMRVLMGDIPEEYARPARVAIGSTLLGALTSWTTGRTTLIQARRGVEEVVRFVMRAIPAADPDAS
ncbi:MULTISPECIES: TetR/AcrR family transcriptional regulator [Streptacidiphilus]|uniref:TetR/AcrR family transcriptional regulator n=1 Tax=Streptacidiphilus cavernicola TaxID=3342716 RepID=A0ABV6UPL2_9ACTN|nr:TetR/AcrR family transcriptional regulator [Streptacidiphilus jeojiense]